MRSDRNGLATVRLAQDLFSHFAIDLSVELGQLLCLISSRQCRTAYHPTDVTVVAGTTGTADVPLRLAHPAGPSVVFSHVPTLHGPPWKTVNSA
jgi:hypothetical protein